MSESDVRAIEDAAYQAAIEERRADLDRIGASIREALTSGRVSWATIVRRLSEARDLCRHGNSRRGGETLGEWLARMSQDPAWGSDIRSERAARRYIALREFAEEVETSLGEAGLPDTVYHADYIRGAVAFRTGAKPEQWVGPAVEFWGWLRGREWGADTVDGLYLDYLRETDPDQYAPVEETQAIEETAQVDPVDVDDTQVEAVEETAQESVTPPAPVAQEPAQEAPAQAPVEVVAAVEVVEPQLPEDLPTADEAGDSIVRSVGAYLRAYLAESRRDGVPPTDEAQDLLALARDLQDEARRMVDEMAAQAPATPTAVEADVTVPATILERAKGQDPTPRRRRVAIAK